MANSDEPSEHLYANGLMFGLRTRPAPEPKNRDQEIAAVRRLLDVLEADPTDPRLDAPGDLCEITPWVACQLGCIVEADTYADEAKQRARLAALAVDVARASGDSDQYFANLLSFANYLLRCGERESASEAFELILKLPLDGGEDERASSHIALAQFPECPPEEATFHYEMGIRTRQSSLPEEVRDVLARRISGVYAQKVDLAGMVHICIVLGLGDPNETLMPHIDKLSLEEAIDVSARLGILGHEEFSRQVRTVWVKQMGSA